MSDRPVHSPGADAIVEASRGGAVLRVRVQPRASRRGVGGVSGGELKVDVGAPAEGGKATAEARRTLADWLDLPPSRLELVSGATARSKRFRVVGVALEDLRSTVADRLRSPGRRGS